MGKKEQVPARGRAIFVQGSLWEWSATSRGRPHDGGLALAVSPMPLSIFLSSFTLLTSLLDERFISVPRSGLCELVPIE